LVEHIPVLLRETVGLLVTKPDGVYADLTLGLGGHSEAALKLLGSDGLLYAFDKDPEALKIASARLSGYGDRVRVFGSDFTGAADILNAEGVTGIDGFMMDLGVSTLQLKSPHRGFMFSAPAPLDMRMDPTRGKTAGGLIRELDVWGLEKVIREYGEERWARAIARVIKARASEGKMESTSDLADAVKDAVPRRAWPPKTHPATRTFQALRIAVNDELTALGSALDEMLGLLNAGGRAVVISYHSLEDRIVKTTFRTWARGCDCPPDFPVCVCGKTPRVRLITRGAVIPSDEEVELNPSARSAKLRAAERIL